MSFPAELDTPSISSLVLTFALTARGSAHVTFLFMNDLFCPGPVMTVSEVVFLYIKQATEDATCDYLQVCLRSHSWCTRSTVQFE